MLRITKEKGVEVHNYFIAIFNNNNSRIESFDKLVKYLTIPKLTMYRSFLKEVSLREDLLNKKENVEWSKVTKKIPLIY